MNPKNAIANALIWVGIVGGALTIFAFAAAVIPAPQTARALAAQWNQSNYAVWASLVLPYDSSLITRMFLYTMSAYLSYFAFFIVFIAGVALNSRSLPRLRHLFTYAASLLLFYAMAYFYVFHINPLAFGAPIPKHALNVILYALPVLAVALLAARGEGREKVVLSLVLVAFSLIYVYVMNMGMISTAMSLSAKNAFVKAHLQHFFIVALATLPILFAPARALTPRLAYMLAGFVFIAAFSELAMLGAVTNVVGK